MKKIFIITGEASGDNLAGKIVNKIKEIYPKIEILAIGGKNIKTQNVRCIFDIDEISFMGFIDVIKNLCTILRKINYTVDEIIKFNPDVILSVDSPDFCFRVLKKVKKINNNIKTIHLVAPQVWAWRKSRREKLNNYIDHLLCLFPFETKYFDGYLKNTFVGHPFFDSGLSKVISNSKKEYITFAVGSRKSEINIFLPIFIQIIKNYNDKKINFNYHFPVLEKFKAEIENLLILNNIYNYTLTIEDKNKDEFIQKSILSVAKSGTITLDICKNLCPIITVYKTSFLNYFFIKPFVNVKYGNIVNIMSNSEIIPELIQKNCTVFKIQKKMQEFLDYPKTGLDQVKKYREVLEKIATPECLKKISSIVLE